MVLCRRVSGLEEDLDNTEQKMVAAVGKLDKASTAADDSERAKKVNVFTYSENWRTGTLL